MTDVAKIENAPDADVLSLSDVLALAGTARHTGKTANTVMADMHKKAAEAGLSPEAKVPIITIKHRWIKGKTFVVQTTMIPFNMDGIAKVKHLGNAIVDVEAYIRSSHGLAEIVSIEAPKDPSLEIDELVVVSTQEEPEIIEEPKPEPKEEVEEEELEEDLVSDEPEDEDLSPTEDEEDPEVEDEPEELIQDEPELSEDLSVDDESGIVTSDVVEVKKIVKKPPVIAAKIQNVAQDFEVGDNTAAEQVIDKTPPKRGRGRPRKGE